MIKHLSCVVLCFSFSLFPFSGAAESMTVPSQAHDSFNLSLIEKVGSCSYTVLITTSCSSTKYTRDQISLSFGDAYGNQIYAPRIDDPSTGAFERCSSDTFEINGPCAYQICYVYFYRTGTDGWKPESIKIKGYYSGTVKFNFNTYIPGNIWYGFNLCDRASSAHPGRVSEWFGYVILSVLTSLFLL
ncbi:hypothetical protein K2173_008690 [Erythroxylum novogranatense]|uniref:Embryo-specific protein ATS3B n=1 Tax=Erythroxylum novogranatense TaxID=1862640 RepID=A0AAV8SM16_9ROSI|nr:hypothetical protein K2173_008690 [Erythroxylum novogranatense]